MGAYLGEAESDEFLSQDFSMGKVQLGLSYDTSDRKRKYLRGIRFYDRKGKLTNEVAGEEEEDEEIELQILENEKIVGAKVSVFGHYPCEISFLMVTMSPMIDTMVEDDECNASGWAPLASSEEPQMMQR